METSIDCIYPLETPMAYQLRVRDFLGAALVADLVAVLLQKPGGQGYHMIALAAAVLWRKNAGKWTEKNENIWKYLTKNGWNWTFAAM